MKNTFLLILSVTDSNRLILQMKRVVPVRNLSGGPAAKELELYRQLPRCAPKLDKRKSTAFPFRYFHLSYFCFSMRRTSE